MTRMNSRAAFRIPAPARALVLSLLAVFALFSGLRAELPKLLPREAFLGGMANFGHMISPDGSRLAYLGPTDKGGLGVWVRTPGKDDARLVSAETGGMGGFDWAYDNRHLLFLRDSGEGKENFHLFSFDLETGTVRDLTPFKEVKAQNIQLQRSKPDEALIGLNRRAVARPLYLALRRDGLARGLRGRPRHHLRPRREEPLPAGGLR